VGILGREIKERAKLNGTRSAAWLCLASFLLWPPLVCALHSVDIFDDLQVVDIPMFLGIMHLKEATRVNTTLSLFYQDIDYMNLVVVGMSGGVDSSVTAKLLADQVSQLRAVRNL
jgi:tRNA methyl transferase